MITRALLGYAVVATSCASDPPCGAKARVCERFETGSWTQLGSMRETGSGSAALDGTHARSGDRALHVSMTPAPGSHAVLFDPTFDHPGATVRLTADAF